MGKSHLKTETLERYSYIATIAASVVAIFAFGFGYYQFRDTQNAQRQNIELQNQTLSLDRESKAIDLTVKYLDLKTTGTSRPTRADRRDQEAVVIAESIFDLAGENEGWKETAKWMVEEQADYIKANHLGCASFNRDFIEYVKQTVVDSNICN